MFTFVLLIIIIFILTNIKLNKYFRLWTITRNFNGPPALPLIGNLLFFWDKPEKLGDKMFNLPSKYGDTVRIWLGLDFNLLMTNPKDLETIFNGTKLITKADQYKPLRPWLHEGLLISNGEKWMQRRKIITPAFHFKNLEKFVVIFENQSKVFIEKLKQFSLDDEIYMLPLISLYTLDVICESAMGVSVNAQTHSDSEYVRAVDKISTITQKRMFDIYRFDLIFKFSPLAREEKKTLKILHAFTDQIIVKRRDELLKKTGQDQTKTQEIQDGIGTKDKLNFLDILLHSEIDGKPLSNLDIQEEVDTFMFAGHETTKSAINWCLYYLALVPRTQEKCIEEIYKILGTNRDRCANINELNSLSYLECVIKETLRLCPPVPIIGRKVSEETIINDKHLPAETNIAIAPIFMSRSYERFKRAIEFIPERFINGLEMKIPFSYIPFSLGPRNCIGQKFAMLEIKSFLSKFLQFYEIELCYPGEAIVPYLALTLKTKNKIKFRVKPRIY